MCIGEFLLCYAYTLCVCVCVCISLHHFLKEFLFAGARFNFGAFVVVDVAVAVYR